uniref:Uncharacterized protein n=1 Tax=Equus caballus TaxID=9796 RepID=A0A9L0RNE3_HORSE
MAGSYGSSIFNFLRNLQTVFHRGCTNLHILTNSAQRFPFLLVLANTYYFLFFFLITAILTDVRQYRIVILLCISLMISDVEHLFMCLLAICKSSLEKCLFRSSAHFLIGLLVFLLLSCMSLY